MASQIRRRQDTLQRTPKSATCVSGLARSAYVFCLLVGFPGAIFCWLAGHTLELLEVLPGRVTVDIFKVFTTHITGS